MAQSPLLGLRAARRRRRWRRDGGFFHGCGLRQLLGRQGRELLEIERRAGRAAVELPDSQDLSRVVTGESAERLIPDVVLARGQRLQLVADEGPELSVFARLLGRERLGV